MTSSLAKRVLAAFILAAGAGGAGYALHTSPPMPVIATETIATLSPGSTRVIYSLQNKQNDQEILALITEAKKYAYFAMYEFTLKDIADALVAAKQRGVDVAGVVDSGEAANSYDHAVIQELIDAGIPVKMEKHADGNGIMHIKALATENAYAIGSYNWTASATTENDELLEIGTDPSLVQTYTRILKTLVDTYPPLSAAPEGAAVVSGTYDYTEASSHVGDYAAVTGTLVDAHTSSSGTVFLDFCTNYKTCPFSGVIFAGDAKKFPNLQSYVDKQVMLTGKISSYQGRAEMILSDSSQIK